MHFILNMGTKKINYQLGYDINIESTFGKRIDGNTQSQSDVAFFASTELEIIPELFSFKLILLIS